jgi:hypothetical protein
MVASKMMAQVCGDLVRTMRLLLANHAGPGNGNESSAAGLSPLSLEDVLAIGRG